MDIKWTPDLEVGVEVIDGQHKELFNRYNKLIQAIWDSKPRSEITDFLDFLQVYVNEHFQAEESLMEQSQYPGFPEHRAIHAAFIEDLSKLRADLEGDSISTESTIKLLNGTYEWLRNHIKGTDQQLGAFLNSKS
jgi:hemerythrin